MLVYLDDYRKAHTATISNTLAAARLKNGTTGADVMNAQWSPAMLYALPTASQRPLSPELPDDMSKIDIDALMNRIYALASQV